MQLIFFDNKLLLGAIVVTVVGLAAVALMRRSRAPSRHSRGSPSKRPALGAAAPAEQSTAESGPLPFSEPLLATMTAEIHRRAFGVENFDYEFSGEHREVVNRVRALLPEASTSRQYIPRKPQVIPRLLAALRSDKGSREQLVGILLEDPQLSADVLKLANSPAYRISRDSVDNIDRAVSLLGNEGLRSLVAGAVLQPMFQVQKGYFDKFSSTIWMLATRSARAAQDYARLTVGCDEFSAHMATLLHHVSHIVLFRLAIDQYDVVARGSRPRAEVLIAIIEECNDELALGIARNWELPDDIIDGLDGYAAKGRVADMRPVAQALYYGRICGAAMELVGDGTVAAEEVIALLKRQGMDSLQVNKLWRKLMADGD